MEWISANPAPYSDIRASQSNLLAGMHQHYFYAAIDTLSVGANDTLFAYVYLNVVNTLSEVMLKWYDGTWEHRACWGANNPLYGTDGSNSRGYMGTLPTAGQWMRLEVPARLD